LDAESEPLTGVTRRLVAEINRVHKVAFTLRSRCPAGVQNGAWQLADRGGQPAILKWSMDGSAAQILHRAATVARLSAAGYPTPRWQAAGATADGRVYHVQELVPGTGAHPLKVPAAELLLAVLEQQAGLDPDPAADRNQQVRAAVLDDSAGGLRWSVRQLGAPGRSLIARYDRLLGAHPPVLLPAGDMVHGDFNTCNILIHQGRVSGVIDVEALSSGSRVIDYACLLREAYVEDYDIQVRRMLHRAGTAVAGPAALALCVTATAFFIVGFKRRHQPESLTRAFARLHQLADDLAAA
jgi:aminoglycoside phosphotransferase (APT) family kinase protein